MGCDQEWVQAVVAALPRAAIVQGGDERVIAVNRRFTEMFGLDGREVDLTPGAPLDPVVEAVCARFAARPDWVVDTVHAIAARKVHRAAEIELVDGRTVRRDVEPLYDRSGAVVGSLWTAEDISAAKRREHALERDNQALAELARQRNDFLAAASHNLRTPLTSILGFCALLADPAGGPLEAGQREFLDAIARNARRMEREITALMDTTAMRAPQLALEFGPVDVGRMLTQAVLDRMATTAAAGVFTVLDAQAGPALHGDEHRLAAVLANLLENAAKFTPPGGRIRVTAEAGAGEWTVAVADTGIGVPEQYREEIFSGFTRAPNAEDGGFAGTGLGLAFSRAIARRHGGDLTVGPAAGGGAVFTLRLPLGGPDAGAGR
ncbi:sensor histidine kinase [Streptomyces bambusae]|uniref:PAS domain-containing sensor histidine kinase n=1 Tax=Streptomyces bambusae TaxID=1550616 RepID=UPI001D000089|nr:PAS domain-containing sensor histidine kinase [Streptomyces bambusae]MCB5169228.1 sensor histidine kinase [Streptomyces bambusae]